jgi:5,6-dimethylbenzimidazole synthase/histidinol-phosphate aminotransferase
MDEIVMRDPIDPLLEAYHGGIDPAELAPFGIKPENAIDFSSNILPFGPSPNVLAAIRTTAIDRYPDRECGVLRNAIAMLHTIAQDRILVGNGCSELIHLIASSLIRPGAPILIVGPTFSEYSRASRLANGHVHYCLADAENDFDCPVVEMDAMLSSARFAVVWICNPNNPTGRSFHRNRLFDWLREFPKTVFVIDEAYIEFTDDVESLIDCEFENLIVLRSMTKAYAMAGLRLGYAVMGHALHREIRGRRAPWSVNAIAQVAGVEAIQDQQYYVDAMARLQIAKQTLMSGLAERDFRPRSSDTCFFLLPISHAVDVRNALLADGLVTRDCRSFGIQEHLRIAVHEPTNNLRLLDALSKWKAASSSSASSRVLAALDSPVDSETQNLHLPLGNWDAEFRMELNRLFRRRRDVRRFRREAIPMGWVRRWIEAACLAPSVGLSQPWRFVAVNTPQCRSNVIAEFEIQNDSAASNYDAATSQKYLALKLAGLREAPEHMAVFVELEPQQGRGLGRATMPESVAYSVVAAIQNFWLAARSEGVGVGWVSILRPDAIAEILDVPSSWQLIAYLCIGFPEASADEVPELEREGWEQRIDVDSLCFER